MNDYETEHILIGTWSQVCYVFDIHLTLGGFNEDASEEDNEEVQNSYRRKNQINVFSYDPDIGSAII